MTSTSPDLIRTLIEVIAGFAAERFASHPVFADLLPRADDPHALGALLWSEYARSLQSTDGNADPGAHELRPPGCAVVAPLEFLKLLDCLEHESNAAPDYYESPACLVLDAMRRRAIRLLPGYEDSPPIDAARAASIQPPPTVH